jgi:hypothetical protein
MQKQIDSLFNIFQNAQEQIIKIKNVQNCNKKTQNDVCKSRPDA